MMPSRSKIAPRTIQKFLLAPKYAARKRTIPNSDLLIRSVLSILHDPNIFFLDMIVFSNYTRFTVLCTSQQADYFGNHFYQKGILTGKIIHFNKRMAFMLNEHDDNLRSKITRNPINRKIIFRCSLCVISWITNENKKTSHGQAYSHQNDKQSSISVIATTSQLKNPKQQTFMIYPHFCV